jgi:enoyl-CoA hydratase/carnithine racemase
LIARAPDFIADEAFETFFGQQGTVMPDFKDLLYEVRDRVAIITLNRPELLNAARIETHGEMLAALDLADRDHRVATVVVTGRGRAFCAGTDLGSGRFALPREGDPATGTGVHPDIGGRTALRIFDMRKPVIGAVNGAAIGFGATILLAMDFRFAAEEARFGFVFSRRGIVAESCSSWFLPRLVGIETALDWMLTGRIFSAEEALEKRLVREVVPAAALLDRALALAKEIAETTSPASVALNRRLLWRMLGAPDPEIAHRLESRALAATLSLPDAAEGVAAFKEKRAPNFTTGVEHVAFMDSWWPQLAPGRTP